MDQPQKDQLRFVLSQSIFRGACLSRSECDTQSVSQSASQSVRDLTNPMFTVNLEVLMNLGVFQMVCKAMQSHAKPCKAMQSHAKSCLIYANLCKVMQSHVKSCKDMQSHPKSESKKI